MKKFFLVALFLTACGIGLSVLRPPFLEGVEGRLYDLRLSLRRPPAPSGRLVLVTVDEKSLQEVGRWPWSRGLVARLFEEIVLRGAQFVVPDIFFAEPSQGAVGERNDRSLSETLHRYPNIFMGYYFLLTPQELEDSALEEETLRRNLQNIAASALPQGSQDLIPRRALGVQDTLPIFSNLSGGRQGFFNFVADPDGTVRSPPLLIEAGGRLFPSMALQVALAASGGASSEAIAPLHLNRQGDFLVNYRGGGPVFSRVSAVDFLREEEGVSLKDKIVLVGAIAEGLEDHRPTPIGSETPSVVLAAHIIDNLIQGDILRSDRLTDLLSQGMLLLAGIFLGLVLPRVKPAQGFFIFLGLIVVEAALIYGAFVGVRWVLPAFYPLFGTFLVYGGGSFYGFLLEEERKRFVSDTFQRYLSPDVIAELTEHPERIRLGGEKKELTVFFSDIRDFSSIVEVTPPDVLVDFLNSYLTPVTDIIFRNKGLLDKYIGDAVMAVFGTPLPEPEHPRLACQAAVETLRFIKDSQEKWREEFGVPLLRVGIGINTGLMTVGNLGSERRFDYTVMGDAVNLASRLEGLNKYYGTTLLVSASTYEKAGGAFPFREIDLVQVKGKKERTRLYELIVDPSFDVDKLLPLFAEALRLYREGAFRAAKRLFTQCLVLAPEDGPSRLFLERSAQYEENPPEGWEGVTTFLRK